MTKNINILRITPLQGPNIWTYRPVIEVLLDIGELEDCPSNLIPGLYERLTAWLPSLVEHRCGVGERGGFLERLREGTWAGHILEHVVLELQNLAGMRTGFGKTRQTPERGIYKMAFRTRHAEVGRAALAAGRELLLAAINEQPYDVTATVNQLRELVDDLCLGPSTAHIVDAEGLQDNVKALEKELAKLKGQLAGSQSDDLLNQAVNVAGGKLLVATIDGADTAALRDLTDKLKDKLGSAIVVLAGVADGKVALVVGVSKDLSTKVKAGELVNVVAQQVGGKGGGRPDMAMAGGTDVAALPAALAGVNAWVNARL